MITNRVLLALVFAVALTGCTAINSTNFGDMSASYRNVVERYANDNILLNVVRSSKNMPLSFLDIPTIIGTGSVAANAELSGTQITSAGSPNVTSSSAGAGLAVNTGFTFTQASLDNAEFMRSFLKEIPLNILGFKGTERMLPKAVTYTLLIESIELRNNNSSVRRFDNNPLDPNYREFQEFLTLLIESGLTVEQRTETTPIGPVFDKNVLTKSIESWGASTIDQIAKQTLAFQKLTINGRESYQLVRTELKTRICVNKFRTQELFGELISQDAYCKESPRYSKTDPAYARIIQTYAEQSSHAKNMELVIGIRSPGNVFDFLGSVLNAQLISDDSRTVMIPPTQSVAAGHNEQYKKARPLFKVYRESAPPDSVASVKYRGLTYSIADDDDTYTKEVMEFMATLVNVAKIPGAIPPSPSVIVR